MHPCFLPRLSVAPSSTYSSSSPIPPPRKHAVREMNPSRYKSTVAWKVFPMCTTWKDRKQQIIWLGKITTVVRLRIMECCTAMLGYMHIL